MITFENYLKEQTGMSFYDCRVLNVEGDKIRTIFARWISNRKPSIEDNRIALTAMDVEEVEF